MTELFDFASVEATLGAINDHAVRSAMRNQLINDLFQMDVRRVGWRRLHAGDRIGPITLPHMLVIGAVLWNAEDRRFLKEAAGKWRGRTDIAVFDLDDVHSIDAFHAFMPNVPVVTQTPVIAEYVDGILTCTAAGPAAFELLRTLTFLP